MRPLVEELRQLIEADLDVTTDPLLNYHLDRQRVSEAYRRHHERESERLHLKWEEACGFPIQARSYQPIERDRGVAYGGEDSKSSTTFWAMYELVDGGNVMASVDQPSATYHSPVGLLAASNGVHRTLAHVLIGAEQFMADRLTVCSAPWDHDLEQACWALECWHTWAAEDNREHASGGSRHVNHGALVPLEANGFDPQQILHAAGQLRQLGAYTEACSTVQLQRLYRELYLSTPSRSQIGGLHRTGLTIERYCRHFSGSATRADRIEDAGALKRLKDNGLLPLSFKDRLQKWVEALVELARQVCGKRQ
jgi:hypothetical protein